MAVTAVRVGQQTFALAAGESQQVLTQDECRALLLVQNRGPGDLFIGFDVVPGNGSQDFELASGGVLILNNPAPSNTIFLRAAAAAAATAVIVWGSAR